MMFLAGAFTTTYNIATVTTSVGTSNVASYYQESPNNSVWSDKVALDSLNSGTAVTNNLRYKAFTPNGPYLRFIQWGKAAAGDTSTITSYAYPATWDADAVLLNKPSSIICPNLSVIKVFAKAYGSTGRIWVTLKGVDLKGT